MIPRSFFKTLFLCLAFLSGLTSVLAVDATEIRLSKDNAGGGRLESWSAIYQVKKDGQLVLLTQQQISAVAKIAGDSLRGERPPPMVVAVFQDGGTKLLYIASSMRTLKDLALADPRTDWKVYQVISDTKGGKHQKGGACAEISALRLFEQKHGAPTTPAANSKIAPYMLQSRSIIKPCKGGDNTAGCKDVFDNPTYQNKVTAVPRTTQEIDTSCLDGLEFIPVANPRASAGKAPGSGASDNGSSSDEFGGACIADQDMIDAADKTEAAGKPGSPRKGSTRRAAKDGNSSVRKGTKCKTMTTMQTATATSSAPARPTSTRVKSEDKSKDKTEAEDKSKDKSKSEDKSKDKSKSEDKSKDKSKSEDKSKDKTKTKTKTKTGGKLKVRVPWKSRG